MNYILLVLYPTPKPDAGAVFIGLILGFWAVNLLGVESGWGIVGLILLGTTVALFWFALSAIAATVIGYLWWSGYWA